MTEKTTSHKNVPLPILKPNSVGQKTSPHKSGRGRTRAAVLIGVHLIILAHIAQYWYHGRSLSPVEPSEAMYTLELGQLNAGAIFFGLAIISTAIFGRFFCGWGCHLVALQDLSSHLLRRIGFRPKPLRSRMLLIVPFALAFYMFFWPTLKRLWRGLPHPGFSNHLMTENFWYTFPGATVSILTFIVCGGVIIYLLGNKGFCTYACPYGAFFSVADKVAVGRIFVTDACLQCGQCTANCSSNVQVHAEVRDFGMVVDPGCMKCMDCVSVCPHDALYYGLKKRPSGAIKSPLALPVVQASVPALAQNPRGSKKNYDFTLSEDVSGLIVTGLTVYALRGLYDITPLLLSVALGVITAYLAIQFRRVFFARDQRLQNIQLKRNRRFTKSGSLALIAFGGWLIFLVHSSFVQYHRHQGLKYLNRVSVVWEELIFGVTQQGLTTEDRVNIDRAVHRYQLSDRLGLLNVKEVKLGLAIGSLLLEDPTAAEQYLRQAYECDRAGVREMLQEFLAAQGRLSDAEEID